jgi:hypothetical protein
MKKLKLSTQQKRVGTGLLIAGLAGAGLLMVRARLPSLGGIRAMVTGDERVEEIAAAYSWATIARAADVVALADELGADAYDMAALFNFESGGNPQAVNPYSGASGLIQFMPKTAKGLGTTVEQIRGMSWSQQIPYVRAYLAQYAGNGLYPANKLALAVFYPAYMTKGIDTPFPDYVEESNPGIYTPRDYVAKMARNAKLPLTVST